MQRPDMTYPPGWMARALALATILLATAAPVSALGDTFLDPAGARRGGDGVGGIEKPGGPGSGGSGGPVPPATGGPGNGGGSPPPVLTSVATQAEPDSWTDAGGALAGDSQPSLSGSGGEAAGATLVLELSQAGAHAPVTLVVGLDVAGVPFKGGLLFPRADLVLAGLQADATGALRLQATLPPALPAGLELAFQAWVPDAGAPQGLAASNGLLLQLP